jgi:MFS family permease
LPKLARRLTISRVADRSVEAKPSISVRQWLGLNSSTVALLGTILLVTSATELWSPLIPEYIKTLQARAGAGATVAILLIGLYGFYRDGLEAIHYYAGGAISGRLNTRRSLLVFNILPIIGLVILAAWDSTLALFVAIPFIFAWNAIAAPAVLTVVGDSVPAAQRTMVFSLQQIFRRIARIFAYLISAPLVWYLGRAHGVRADAMLAIFLVIGAALIQWRFMRTASRDAELTLSRPRHLFRRFNPELRRLLVADIFARWAEGMAEPFVILYCVSILSADRDQGTALYQSVLLTIQAGTSMLLYFVIAPLASREGLAKKPYINLTFLFFALFPIALIVLGKALGALGLAIAFVIGGLREIGEPARKAMITELVPQDVKTQAIGFYWSVRSMSVMLASPVGAMLWIAGERWTAGAGPVVSFLSAGAVGILGAGVFLLRFGKSRA